MCSTQRGGARTGLVAATAAVALATALAPATAVRAQQPAAAAESLVSLDLRNARLEDAVFALLQQVKVSNVVFEKTPGAEFGQVTLRMADQPFEKVLRALAASAQATVRFEDGIYYLRSASAPAPAAVAPVKAAPVAVATAPVVPATQQRSRGPRQWVRIPLQFVVPSEFVGLLDDPKQAAFMKADDFRLPTKDEIQNIINPSGRPLTPSTPPLQAAPIPSYGGAPVNYAQPLPAGPQPAPVGGQDGLGDAAGQRAGGGGRGGFGGGGAGGFGGGQFGGGQGGPGGGPGGAGGGAQGGQNASLRPEGVEQIISNDADNALLVVGDAQGIEELRNLVRLLDVAPKQVLIRAEFVAVNLNDADAFGVDWRIQPAGNLDANIPPFTGATPTITLAYATGNAVANLRASLIRSRSNVLQAPIITTTNNRTAQIVVSNVETTFQTIQTVTNVGIVSQTIPVPIPASNQLVVTPHINGDNSISLALAPQLQTQELVPGPAGNVGIRSNTQFLTTYRRVQNGETMVLGGFITKTETNSTNRVPILSDLPIIGNLFTSRNRTNIGTETLVFVTPTIIEDRAQGTIGTGGASPAPTP